MSSLRSLNHRRRSQSASTSSTIHREPSWHGSTKRAYPASSGTADFSNLNWDLESWRSKRLRREGSPSGTSSDDDAAPDLSPRSSGRPVFASSSADFNIFPRKESPRLRHSMYDSSDHNKLPSHSELSQIRSNAFWELRRSVAENGEGFVRRMRDYEQSRARSDAFLKVKDAQKRGRKRSSLLATSRKTLMESDDEDEIQIVSGHLSETFLSRNARSASRPPRPPSPNYMDEDPIPTERSSSSSSLYMSDSSSDPLSVYSTNLTHPAPSQHPDITPSLTHTSSANSSIVSLTLPPTASSSGESYSTYSSRSEKALAALSLAMANGAGSITEDYEALRALQPILAIDESEVGEMWH